MLEILANIGKFATATATYAYALFERGIQAGYTFFADRYTATGLQVDIDIDKIIRDFGGFYEIPPTIVQEARRLVNLPTAVKILLLPLLSLVLLASRFGSYLVSAKQLDAQSADKDLRPNLIDQATVIRATLLEPSRFDAAKLLLDKMGIPDDQQVMLWASIEQIPTLTELILLLNREFIDSDEFVETLTRQGFREPTAQKLEQLRHFYPSPSDIIYLIGREAFEPVAIERFQLDFDFELIDPKVYQKAGMTEEVARWYWTAHWKNPSIGQVFSMIHREVDKPDGGKFTLDDLAIYYKLADINPFFGDLLRQIAFNPLGRVDTRRMFRMGVLDRDQVKRSYRHQGYDADNAELLTRYSEREKSEADRDLTRAQVEESYRLGLFDAVEFRALLVALDYTEDDAWAIQYLVDAKTEERRLVSFFRRAEVEYKRGNISEMQVRLSLNSEGVNSDRINDMLTEWENELVATEVLPTKTDWLRWVQSEVVTVAEFRAGMKQRRYSDENITRYLENL